MQAGHIKLIKDQNGRLFTLFYKDGTIFIKQYTNEFSSPQYVVSSGVLPDFSVFVSDSGITVAVKKANGDIFICRNTGDKWEEKHIFKGSPTDSTKLYLYAGKDRLNMIYNCRTQNTDTINYINFSNKKWQKPYVIESFTPFPSCPYAIIRLSAMHILIIFRNSENSLMFKELYLDPFREGKATPVVAGKGSIADFSAIADDDALRMVYVAKGRFGNRLIYVGKDGGEFTDSIVLWEDRRINNCIIYKAKNRLYVLTSIGTNIFATFSDDNGKSFCPLYRHKSSVKGSVAKAEFISSSAACSEAFVSTLYPYEIVVTEEFTETIADKNETIYSNEAKPDKTDELNILKNKIELYEKQISEANKKIGELSLLLSKRNEELSIINSKWLKKVENIRSSYENRKFLPPILVQTPPPEESSP